MPELSSRSLDSVTEAFVILGCDGIFNVSSLGRLALFALPLRLMAAHQALSNEDVARFVLEASSMETACEGAVEAADKVYQNKDVSGMFAWGNDLLVKPHHTCLVCEGDNITLLAAHITIAGK